MKIAISMPKALFRETEKARKERGETRSAFIQRTIEAFLETRRERHVVRDYVAGYKAHPETKDEIEAAEQAATEILSKEPWD
jgi:metal-responsive CopG/Arc/MetJ family transcriptional regulator